MAVKIGGKIQGSVSKAQSIFVKELTFKNRFEFPSIGEANLLYIAIDENKLYRFDSETLTYYCVGADYNDIKVIQCGLE